MELAYLEKRVVMTQDKKDKKTYSYGTLTIRSKQLTRYVGQKVRILIKSIDVKKPKRIANHAKTLRRSDFIS